MIFPYDEYDYLDYKCPKRGEITELIVTSKIRSNGVGQELINKMEVYFKSVGCEYVIVDVFAYNEIGKKFYKYLMLFVHIFLFYVDKVITFQHFLFPSIV